MLNVKDQLQPRPATIPCRRPLLWGLLLVALIPTALACGGREALDPGPARRAAQKAIKLARPTAPYQVRYLERLLADAEVIGAAEANAPWWRAEPERASIAWLRVARAAREISVSIRGLDRQARARYAQALVITRDDIARAAAELREAGMGRREAAAMARAGTSLGMATKLAEAGEYRRAADKLEGARELTQIIHQGWSTLHARFSDPHLLRQWREWAEMTIRESRETGEHVIIIDKLRRRLTLYWRGNLVLSVPAELGANGLRRKEHAGDSATPEGMYRIVQVKPERATKFYKALLINYPNDEDRVRFARGKRVGTIPYRAGIGSLIEIHGEGGQGKDWTDGCVALTNADMDRLFSHVRVGTAVTIVGTYEH